MTMAAAAPIPVAHIPEAPPPDAVPPPPKESILTRVKLFLRPSNFITAIPGPIFHRDVWISGRKSGTYWIRCLYVLLLAVTIALAFAAQAAALKHGASPALRLQALQSVAPIVTKVILWFELCALAFAGAIFGGPTICEEKRAGTLATLLTTPLKAWQIVLGKTFAFFVQLLILTLVAAPLLLAVRVFGGVSAREIFAGTVLSLSTALLAGLCGLWHSIRAKRAPNAMSAGFMNVVFIQGILPLLWLLYAIKFRVWLSPELLIYASTPAALACVTFEPNFGASKVLPNAWIYATLYTLGWCAIIFVAASVRLRAVMAKEGAGGSAIPAGKKVKKRKGTPAPEPQPDPAAPMAAGEAGVLLPDIKRKKRASSVQEGVTRTVSDNPVLWREVRQSSFRSRFLLYAAVAFAVVGMAALYYFFGMDEEPMHYCFAVIGMVLALLSAATTPAAIVSGEREARTWEVLLTSPLSAWSIMVGKVAGAVSRQWLVPAILAVHFLLAVLSGVYYTTIKATEGPINAAIWLWLPLIYIPPVLFLNATGALLSMLCRKSSAAAAANFGIALLIWAIGPGLIGFFMSVIFNARHGAEDIFQVFMCFNPTVLMACAVHATVDNSYELLDVKAGVPGFIAVLLIYCGLYVGAAYLVLKAAAGILASKTLRSK